MEKDHNPNGIGHNSGALQDKSPTVEALESLVVKSAVRFIDKVSRFARDAEYELCRAVSGKNAVVRTVAVAHASNFIRRCMKETADWNFVIKNMKQGKDVHVQENCKSEKLNIVAGEHYDFGQYLINVNSPKWCKENTEGKQFMQEVAELKRPHD
jgi:hypothetical protein